MSAYRVVARNILAQILWPYGAAFMGTSGVVPVYGYLAPFGAWLPPAVQM